MLATAATRLTLKTESNKSSSVQQLNLLLQMPHQEVMALYFQDIRSSHSL
jgi:hypothetical protein